MKSWLSEKFLLLGWDIRQTLGLVRSLRRLKMQYRLLCKQRSLSPTGDAFKLGKFWPVPTDLTEVAGTASGHYFHQDLYVARKIYVRNPLRHIDVGSRIDGFVSHVAVFRPIEVLDIRELVSTDENINFIQADLMNCVSLEFQTDSLSSLHALEHFGLGRYGDQIDFDGWVKGYRNLVSMVKPGGNLYLSVPTGVDQRIEFNAHRVFSLPYLLDFLKADFNIDELAFVDDQGDLHQNLDPFSAEARESFHANMGCSIWSLTKKPCDS